MDHQSWLLFIFLWGGLCMYLSHKKDVSNGGERVFFLLICLILWPLYPLNHLLDD